MSNLKVEWKSDEIFVMIVDCECEVFLWFKIEVEFLYDVIIGEEYGEVVGDSGFCWVLDLIDGMKLFIMGVFLFGMMVVVEYDL